MKRTLFDFFSKKKIKQPEEMCTDRDADSNSETSVGNEATTLQLDYESSSASDEAMSDTSENLGASVAASSPSSTSCSVHKSSKKAKKRTNI